MLEWHHSGKCRGESPIELKILRRGEACLGKHLRLRKSRLRATRLDLIDRRIFASVTTSPVKSRSTAAMPR